MNASERARGLADVLSFNDGMLALMLTDVTDDLARRRLRDEGPSIAWNVGHMLELRNRLAAAVSCEAPDIDLERYTRSATEGRDYPTVRKLHGAWADFSARLLPKLRQLSPEDLSGPSPMRLPHGEQTLLGALRFIVWHETLHLGQVTMLRSHHGLTPTVDLAAADAVAM